MNNKTKHQTTRVAKTYKLDKDLVKEFKMLCEADGKSQASQIELLMNNYINTYNILFGKYDEGNVNISSVGTFMDFLAKFPENMPISCRFADSDFSFDAYNLKNGKLSIYSNSANEEALENNRKIQGTRDMLLNLLNIIK